MEQWKGFTTNVWQKEVNVRDFILSNFEPYQGDESFLEPPTEATSALWDHVMDLTKKERENGGVLDMDTEIVSTITSHGPGYLNKDLEKVVGVQTDEPFKRSLQPFGGIRMAKQACESYGFKLNEEVERIFTDYRKTHNQGVFDAYTDEMKLARKVGIITGLPDAYGRGRIIGDYRRVALYGVDFLIDEKKKDAAGTSRVMSEENIRLREELSEQIRALNELKALAKSYGFDISKPAANAREAFQWLYFAYLAAIKEQNGAAMSLGRVSTFLDIYIERDLKTGVLTEREAQELVDHFVMKLRLVKFARTPDYNELFSGDPTWVTESIGGMAHDGRALVTKNSFRFLHTLDNLGPAPEPNLTVLWSVRLPQKFKNYCAKMSIKTSSIQYENDDIMRPEYGDDYGIACCVSAMAIGKQMQFFGARANLAKALLYAINGGKDEKHKMQVGPEMPPVASDVLDYDEVMHKFDQTMEWLAGLYINTLNVIHYMHDKYCYERIEMALHDTEILRTMATGIAGLSVVADSLSAVKYAKVSVVRDENGIAVDFETEGDFPKYGNNDDRVDAIAVDIVKRFMKKLRKHQTYRQSVQTMSILTITSNVVYGKKTGNTPDGRRAGEPFAPGANPMHGRDTKGTLASLSSVAKLPYSYALDGISNTFSIVPKALGKDEESRAANLSSILDGYAAKTGHHLNVNVFNRETLLDAMEHPEEYPQLTIRVSGYAVNFIKLTKEQQLDVISRTFHESM
ncbi:formate C-acetyltransferase [Bacillus licheniformis]|jgi:formate C-acetyltransferase|uniref:Formate acetyltransferase n=5 Tax=Bacillus licheniformis TaxID=1402 RepID=Q65IU5_BACLD|nr:MULTISPECIES: formate C-acetyltransferase [Bacillus]MBY8346741.1 formate C-acetyltransferase [Bacillus sp. PCH94]MDP4079401.1 formate C-acetyltransferase [Bacillota bacterium]AAU23656.1 putative formate C-acetyltransferase [Bacillus licheniformis DSM 13 = ATCC 14580]AAU41019.1 formate acetyltransferase PflB [Bacillus licheniformis DSM 13 = ATCC 14580]AKQ73301.1 formate C-acetyltransferase [Bacillus licheniformis WX-02]